MKTSKRSDQNGWKLQNIVKNTSDYTLDMWYKEANWDIIDCLTIRLRLDLLFAFLMLLSWFIHVIWALHVKLFANKSEFALGVLGSFCRLVACLVACVCSSLWYTNASNKGAGRSSFTNLYIYCNLLTWSISDNFITPVILSNCDADSLYFASVMALIAFLWATSKILRCFL